MIAELISVGTEILLGNIVNTNSAYLSEKCAQLGLSVYYQTVVGDNEERMKMTIKSALERSDVIILTGGLGPTEDDLTKEITAEVMGFKLIEDSHSRELLETYMKQYEKNSPNRRITKNNYKQAMVPEGAIVLDNHNGTAPGLIMEKNGKTAILLPGPPNEMKPMFILTFVRGSLSLSILRQSKSAESGKARWQKRFRISLKTRVIQPLLLMQKQERFICVLQPRQRMKKNARR